MKNREYQRFYELLPFLRDVILSVLVSVVVFGIMFQVVIISGSSMEPTLSSGDIVLIRKIGYTPESGDIVIADIGDKLLAKRVIGTAGDKVAIDYETSTLYINGIATDEPYILDDVMVGNGVSTYEVDPGCVFLLGDNRNDSLDSRDSSVGCVKESNIKGKVVLP